MKRIVSCILLMLVVSILCSCSVTSSENTIKNFISKYNAHEIYSEEALIDSSQDSSTNFVVGQSGINIDLSLDENDKIYKVVVSMHTDDSDATEIVETANRTMYALGSKNPAFEIPSVISDEVAYFGDFRCYWEKSYYTYKFVCEMR